MQHSALIVLLTLAGFSQALPQTITTTTLMCAGLQTGSTLKHGDIQWAMRNKRPELDLTFGWWNERTVSYRNTDGRDLGQLGVVIDYNHARNQRATTVVQGDEEVACTEVGTWGLSCS